MRCSWSLLGLKYSCFCRSELLVQKYEKKKPRGINTGHQRAIIFPFTEWWPWVLFRSTFRVRSRAVFSICRFRACFIIPPASRRMDRQLIRAPELGGGPLDSFALRCLARTWSNGSGHAEKHRAFGLPSVGISELTNFLLSPIFSLFYVRCSSFPSFSEHMLSQAQVRSRIH